MFMECQIFCNDQRLSVIDKLESEIKVGRKPKDQDLAFATVDGVSYIYLNSQSVSSQHLAVSYDGSAITFTDTSRNGTILQYNGETMTIKQQSKVVDNFHDTQFVLIIKAKDAEFKLIFKYSSLTQSKNKTYPMEETLALTNEPQQKPSASEETPKSRAKRSSAKDKAPKEKAAKKVAEEVEQPEYVAEYPEPAPKKTRKAKSSDESKKEKAVKEKQKEKKEPKKRASKKKNAAVEGEEEVDAEVEQKSLKEEPDLDLADLPADEEAEEAELESDSAEEASSSFDENEQQGSASVSLVEPQNFEDAVDITDFKKQNPRLLFSQPMEKCNFSFGQLLKELYLNDASHYWATSLSEEQEDLLSSFSVLDDGLNPTKITAMFTSKLRTTSRFLLAVLCGMPIISGQLLSRRETVHAVHHSLRVPHATNFLYEPKDEEVDALATEFQALRQRYFEQYSLTEVCRRNARRRMVIDLSVVVTEEGVLGRKCEDEDDVYSYMSFCYVLVQLGMKVKVATHVAAECRKQRLLLGGRSGLRPDLLQCEDDEYDDFLQKTCEAPWLLLVKDRDQFPGVQAKKLLKAGVTCCVFLGEDVAKDFCI